MKKLNSFIAGFMLMLFSAGISADGIMPENVSYVFNHLTNSAVVIQTDFTRAEKNEKICEVMATLRPTVTNVVVVDYKTNTEHKCK